MNKPKKTPKYLIVASTESYSGKSATILGIAAQLQQQGLTVGYSKPISREKSSQAEADVSFIADKLSLSPELVYPPIIGVSKEAIAKVLNQKDAQNYAQTLSSSWADSTADLIIIEGPANLWEGGLFKLSVPEMAKLIDASVLLVSKYQSVSLLDILLKAKVDLQDHLLGVVINNIPPDAATITKDLIQPYLQQQNIPVLGMLPKNNLLNSISVREIARKLQAKILCREDRLDLMVENLAIGAMNVNSAMEYFRKWKNMAVVTGSDRADVQLAALENSTHCLILTGHTPPQNFVLSRAEDLEIPILSVDLDTLTTVEIIDGTFGRVRLQEPIKVQCIQELMKENFAIDQLITNLGLELPVKS